MLLRFIIMIRSDDNMLSLPEETEDVWASMLQTQSPPLLVIELHESTRRERRHYHDKSFSVLKMTNI